jgi:hypothetical protein
MAVTPTITVENGGQLGTGNDKYAYGSITVTGTYVTGGFALDLPSSNFDMSSIRYLRASGSGRLLEWDVTNQKLLVKAWATAGPPWLRRRSRTAPTSAPPLTPTSSSPWASDRGRLERRGAGADRVADRHRLHRRRCMGRVPPAGGGGDPVPRRCDHRRRAAALGMLWTGRLSRDAPAAIRPSATTSTRR